MRFLVIGAVAFGGGQAALPLVERLAVADTGWLTPQEFATGVGLAYVTPGPVLILAAYVGYRVHGVAGALGATAAVFCIPTLLATTTARLVSTLNGSLHFRAFGRYAAAAAVGLLGVTAVAMASPIVRENRGLVVVIACVAVLERFGTPAKWLLVVGVVTGAILALMSRA